MTTHLRATVCFAALCVATSCFGAGELPTIRSFTNAVDRECFAFAQNFCERAPKGQITVEEVLDFDALFARSIKGLRTSDNLRANFLSGVKQGLGSKFVSQFQQVRNLRLINLRHEGKETRAVLRIITHDGALNYSELVCERARDRSIRAVDVFNWTTGEYISDTMHRMIALMQQQSLSPLGRLTGKEDPNVELAKAINDMNQMSATGQWEAVLQRYAQLTPALQREKLFAMMRARAAAKTNEKEYLEALKFWQVNFPRDPSIDLISFDAVYFQKKYDVALTVLERLDRNVGGDPFLDFVRSGLYQKLGQPAVAKERAKEALRREPELVKLASPELLRLVSDGRAVSTANSTAAGGKPGTGKMRLQGVFMHTDRPAALISGQNVCEGDSVEGLQVVKIEKSRVTLQSADGDFRSLTFD